MPETRFAAADLADCAEREVKQRQRVFPRWVSEGKISPEFAAKQIAMMQAIASDYRTRAEAETMTADLFGSLTLVPVPERDGEQP